MSKTKYAIDPLYKIHNRAAFSWCHEALDKHIQKQASQDSKRNVSRTFVLTEKSEHETIPGFYTLSTFSIAVRSVPGEVR